MKVDYVCAYCGSSEISRDAWADWDAATQQWVLGAVFDYAHCHRCERETSLGERQAPEPEPRAQLSPSR